MRWTRWIGMLMAVGLAGCASNPPSAVLAEGPRMIDLYRGTPAVAEDGGRSDAGGTETEVRCRWWLFSWPCGGQDRGAGAADGRAVDGAAAYTRTAANELEFLFPRLPNPDIYIHVLPHLATEARVPVPGYTTAVPLYERVEYALPGELDRAHRLLEPATGDGGNAAAPSPGDGTPDGGTVPPDGTGEGR